MVVALQEGYGSEDPAGWQPPSPEQLLALRVARLERWARCIGWWLDGDERAQLLYCGGESGGIAPRLEGPPDHVGLALSPPGPPLRDSGRPGRRPSGRRGVRW